MKRPRNQIVRRFILATVLTTSVCISTLPAQLQGKLQTPPNGVDPNLFAMANAGDAKSQLLIGLAYEKGEGAPFDPSEAVTWLRKAAKNGNPSAQFILAWDYYFGNKINKNYTEAASWFRKASLNTDLIDLAICSDYGFPGYPNAYLVLGYLFEEGKDLPQDYSQAALWYRMAAEKGEVSAQVSLGSLYLAGNGVEQDYNKAAIWFRKAAEQGSVDAQSILGALYIVGHGVPQDFELALKWLEKAAGAGDGNALYNMGTMYLKGQGVDQSYGQAYLLFDVAAARLTGLDQANAEKGRDLAAQQLTPEMISVVQKNAAKLFASFPPKP
jgi:hypothetical protein